MYETIWPVLIEFAPTTIKNWLDWLRTVMLGSSSKGKRLELPVIRKLFVNGLGGSGTDDSLDARDPKRASVWAESRIEPLVDSWFSLAQTPPERTSVHE